MGYSAAIDYLYGLQHHGIKLGLENTKRLLSLLGEPQQSFKSIHVAGTNGKGSTSVIAASLLSVEDRKTGLYTSPHLVSFTERIRVNGREITEDEVVALTEEIRETADGAGLTPTFFEFATVMCFLYFKRKAVEWAVIETGMGGRLDATNVLEPEATVITPISFDHREFLGETIEAIAAEKAGIIKYNTPVVSALQSPEAMRVIERHAADKGATLYVAGKEFKAINVRQGLDAVSFDYLSGGLNIEDIEVPLAGAYQADNAALAIKALTLVSSHFENIKSFIKKGLWSHLGRLEFIAPDILIDGAHNPSAAEAFAGAIKDNFSDRRMALIAGVMGDKDIDGILRPLLPLFEEIIFTAPDYDRAASPEALKRCASALGYEAKTAPSIERAIAMARESGHGLIVITGSFYTIGEARASIKKDTASSLSGLR